MPFCCIQIDVRVSSVSAQSRGIAPSIGPSATMRTFCRNSSKANTPSQSGQVRSAMSAFRRIGSGFPGVPSFLGAPTRKFARQPVVRLKSTASNAAITGVGPSFASQSSMPLPFPSSHSRNPTSEPRVRNSRDRRARATLTSVFRSMSASKAIVARRPLQVILARSGITPFSGTRVPLWSAVFPITPFQFQTPDRPMGRNSGISRSSVAKRHRAIVLNSPSVMTIGMETSASISGVTPAGKYSRFRAPGSDRYLDFGLPFSISG